MRDVVLTAAFVALMAGLGLGFGPALADVWGYKSGLWEETFASATADIPAPAPRRFCIASSLVMFPGPDLYEYESCREKVISKTDVDSEVEVICGEPALRDRPVRMIRERHHLAKDGRGMSVDRREIQSGVPRLLQTTTQRWIGESCGDVPAR